MSQDGNSGLTLPEVVIGIAITLITMLSARVEAVSPSFGASRQIKNKPNTLMGRELGVTLLELLVVIAIAGILAAIAVPSFVSIIKRDTTSAQANNLVFMLNFARSEAVKQDASVIVCPSSDGQTCTNSNTWQIGWMAYCLSGAAATSRICSPVGNTLVPLRSSPSLPLGYTLTSAALASLNNQLTFISSGGVSTPASFTLCDSAQEVAYALDVEVLITGRTEASQVSGKAINGTALTCP